MSFPLELVVSWQGKASLEQTSGLGSKYLVWVNQASTWVTGNMVGCAQVCCARLVGERGFWVLCSLEVSRVSVQ